MNREVHCRLNQKSSWLNTAMCLWLGREDGGWSPERFVSNFFCESRCIRLKKRTTPKGTEDPWSHSSHDAPNQWSESFCSVTEHSWINNKVNTGLCRFLFIQISVIFNTKKQKVFKQLTFPLVISPAINFFIESSSQRMVLSQETVGGIGLL